MKTLLCYFSGTGNTKKVVDEFAKCYKEDEIDIKLIEKDEINLSLEGYDSLGIAYPIHAFNAPSIIVEFVKKLKKQDHAKKLFIIKTSGEPLALNNISSYKIKSILKKKNLLLSNEYHIVMPYNIMFRHTDDMAYRMWQTAQQMVPVMYKEITENKKAKLKYFFMGHFLAWIFRIEFWGGRFNGKKYKVNDKCIHCGKCARSCPVGNIKIKEDGTFEFGDKCIMCMRCSFFCPTNAIKIGLFEKWKVWGAYHFQKPDEAEKDRHKRYCKNSYKKYFARCEKKINEYKNSQN